VKAGGDDPSTCAIANVTGLGIVNYCSEFPGKTHVRKGGLSMHYDIL